MTDSEQASADSRGTPATQTIGQILREAREAEDLTLEQLATELRIDVQQLAALEDDRFERIGVPVFVKGYLRHYGQRVGVDPRELLALYYQQTKLQDVQIQPHRPIRMRNERQITVWVVALLVLALIVVGLGAWWVNGGEFGLVGGTPSAAPSDAPVAAAPAALPPAPASVPAVPISAPVAAPVETLSEPPDGPAETPETSSDAVAAEDQASAVVAAALAPVVIPLELTFAEESWAEVTDGRGERLFYGLGARDQRTAVRGEPPFAVVLGNAAGVRLTVDGESYPIPAQGRRGNLVRFSVDIAEE